jgi:DNA-binding transcriptional LysR family regulator
MPAADLSDLDAFAAIARQRSFRRAASLRGVSVSSLSEAVRRLETRLGVRLLNRTTRSVTTTEAGQRLLDRLEPALAEVASSLDALNAFRDSASGTLRLNVPGIVGRLILPPILTRFLRQYPGINVEIVAEDTFIDVLAAGFDAGVRYDERLEKDMIAVPLGPRSQRFVVAGAPSYFAQAGRPVHPNELLGHACIRHRFASGVVPAWEFEKDGETIRVSPPARMITTATELALAAARDGLGLVAMFEDFLAPDLRRDSLESVLEDWSQPFSGPFLYYPSRRHMPAPLRAFVDFIKAEAHPR